MNERENEDQLKHDNDFGQQPKVEEPPVDKNVVLLQNLVSIFFNGIWGCFFYLYSTHEDKYGGDSCVNLRVWGYLFSIYCIIFILIRLFVNLPLLFLDDKQTIRDWVAAVFKICDVLETFILVIFVIGITVVMFQNEECQALHTLSLIFLIVIYSTLALLVCCFLCSVMINGSNGSNGQNQGQ